MAFIFLETRGVGLGLVKLEGLTIGLRGNANFRFASKGDILTVVISSGIVSVVDGISVVVIVCASVVKVVGAGVVSRSIIGLVFTVSVVDVVDVIVVDDGLSDVCDKIVILTGYFIVD